MVGIALWAQCKEIAIQDYRRVDNAYADSSLIYVGWLSRGTILGVVGGVADWYFGEDVGTAAAGAAVTAVGAPVVIGVGATIIVGYAATAAIKAWIKD